MIGAILGDVLGSAYEFDNPKTSGYPLLRRHWNRLKTSQPTDDSVCTLAITESILSNKLDFSDSLRRWSHLYSDKDYGTMYMMWLTQHNAPAYNSWGNGAIMRTSACALLSASDEEAMLLAEAQSNVTHNHPNAVHAAKALVIAIRMALRKEKKETIRQVMSEIFGYDLSFNYTDLQFINGGRFDISAGGTLRLALTAVLEATDFEDAIRKCIDLGGDTDTTAAVAGPLAEILYGIPTSIKQDCYALLSNDMIKVLEDEYNDPRAINTLTGNGKIYYFEKALFESNNHKLLTGDVKYLKSIS